MFEAVRFRKSWWACFAILSVAAGCMTMTSGNDADGDGASSDLPGNGGDTDGMRGDLGGLFDADEAWIIGSPTLLMFGFGSKVEFLIGGVQSSSPQGCVGKDPGGTLSYSNGVLAMDLEFDDRQSDQRCTLELTAPVSDCQAGGICQLALTRASFSIGDLRQNLADVGLTRLLPCAPTPASLPDEVWSLLNVHPLLIPVLDDLGEFGEPIMILAGQGPQTLIEGVVISGVDAAGNAEGCIDSSLDGMVDYNGRSLEIDVPIEGRDNAQRRGVDGQCNLNFSGSVTYCAELGPESFGSASTLGPLGQFIRVDGVGGLTGEVVEEAFDSLYILIGEFDATPGGGTGPGPGVRARLR